MSVPGSTAPVVSVTTPANVAVVCCAVLQVAVPIKTRPTKTSIQVLQRIPASFGAYVRAFRFRKIDMPDWSGLMVLQNVAGSPFEFLSSPPKLGGVAAPSIKCCEATEAWRRRGGCLRNHP